ncbi:cysteine desulfurase [bacterium]|nr:cysteine desulfurase [bacterium]
MIATSACIVLSGSALAFDFQASTPCAAEVVEAMAPFWSADWGNPSSRQHRLGLSASAAVKLARRQLAEALEVKPERLVFTSGATEANNLALLGHARALGSGHLISVATEHHAVLDPLQQLQREGFSVTLLTPGPDGLISPEQLEAAITPETRLVSVMAANNEIGVLQPLEQLGTVCRRHGITLHSDGAQAFGTLPLNPDALGVDLLSLSAHKLYGPKGIGALVLREDIAIEPLQWGGGQEAGLRAGTLPTALIVGFAAAARLALQEQEQRNSRLQHLRDQLWEGLQQRLPGVLLNGALQPRLPQNLNISLPGVNGSRLHRALRPHLACSSGSACSNGAPSHVLQAIGRSRAEAEASLRLSLGRETTADDVDQAITAITDAAAAAGFLSGR